MSLAILRRFWAVPATSVRPLKFAPGMRRATMLSGGAMPVKPSPKVCRISWGMIEAEGIPRARDLKLYPGGGREWDWRETGTRHRPGIQPADVQELIDKSSEVVILSRGMHLMLETMPETLVVLADAGLVVHIRETNDAVSLYNTLAVDRAVGALLHSTC
jgi:hypothetical protein